MHLLKIIPLYIILSFSFAFFNVNYKVLFEEKPDIKDKKVYFKGMPIGKVEDIYLSERGFVVVEVSIESKYRKFIKDTGVFYVEEGKLNYTLIEEKGHNIEPGSELLGFETKGKYLLFKAKSKFGKLVENIERAIEDLKKEK